MTTSITSLPSATTPLTGAERVPMDQTVGTAVAATALVAGTGYRIETVGTTNWTACGLPAGVTAAVGLTFVASAAGTGTGTAIESRTVEATAQAIADLAGTDLTYDPATRLLSSSTGEDVTLPLVSLTAAGLLSEAGWLKLDSITVDRATLTVASVRNNSGATIAKGTPVIVTGSSGTTKTIAPADASSEATAANTLGLTLDAIANNADGFVVTEGPLSGVNTAGLAEGQLIYLSETTGGITSTRPIQPAHGVVLGWCVKAGAGTAGILYVKVDNGVELDELHDVLITSPTAGQVLRRADDGLWKNAELVVGDSNIVTAGLSQASLNGRPVAPFAPSTAYSKGDLVSLFGLVYRRKTAGTSGATFDPSMWDLQSAADGANGQYYTVGKYFNPSIAPTTTGIAVGQNTIFFYPFPVRRRVKVDGVQVRVTTAAASTTFQCAIYAASAANLPTGLPLASTADMSLAATTAVAAPISPTWLDPNKIYFRAINVSGGSTGVFTAPSPSHPEAVNLIGATTAFASSVNSNLELSFTWPSGTWPDMTGRTVTEGSVPRVSMSLLASELG